MSMPGFAPFTHVCTWANFASPECSKAVLLPGLTSLMPLVVGCVIATIGICVNQGTMGMSHISKSLLSALTVAGF
ncbi:hypothetical protein DFH07DRAFT_1067708, partial [Mycena maculata]